MAQLMPLPLTVSCSSKIQIGFTFLVPAYPGCPGKEAVKWLSGKASFEVIYCVLLLCLQCSDAVGWAARRASAPLKLQPYDAIQICLLLLSGL